MELDLDQKLAIMELDKVRRRRKDEVVVAGPAGTGKSSVIGEFINGTHVTKVAAPTHKACDVLRRKGVKDVQTIHSLMYEVREKTEDRPLVDKEGRPVLDPITKDPMVETIVVGQKWVPREEVIRDMIIFEEASMIGGRMVDDIRRLVLRRAFVGDPYQLPPVKDRDVFGSATPDATLTKVWRIDDSPPLALATAVREGRPAYPHLFDVEVISKTPGTWEMVAQQQDAIVICWKNATRHWINKQIRRARNGDPGWVPVKNDRVVFYETDTDLGVYNGLGAIVDEIHAVDQYTCKLRVRTDAGQYRTVNALSAPFRGETISRNRRRDEDDPLQVEYAYAITCHKSQGSEWPHVFVVDDVRNMVPVMGAGHAKRWLYTAVTRTTRDLTIVR